MSEPTLQRVHLDNLKISPLNPRKTIHLESITEVAESILEHGILQPPLARPLADGSLELLCGQRRLHASYRAVALASERDLPAKGGQALPDGRMPKKREEELEWMPVLVREVSDTAAEEIMLVENLHREDVSPREEAEGYARLLELTDGEGGRLYTVESLAAKLGKSRRYLSRRLRLRMVPELMWTALEEGKVSTRHLELVGRIPHPKTREEVAKRVLAPKLQDHALTVLQTEELIRSNYVASLKNCGFDLDDADLVPLEHKNGEAILGGACKTCPYRTGNDPDLREELMQSGGEQRKGRGGIDPNLCTNVRCLTEKQEAVWRRMKAHAEEGGTRVLDVDRTASIFRTWGEKEVMPESGLVDLASRPSFEHTGNHASEDEAETWDELVTGTDAVSKVILARHPETKRVHRLLEVDVAVAAAEKKLKEEKKPNLFAQRPQKTKSVAAHQDSKEYEETRRQQQLELKVRMASYDLLLDRLGDGMRDTTIKIGQPHPVWPVLVKVAFLAAVVDDRVYALKLLGITEEEAGDTWEGEELWALAQDKVLQLTKGGNELPMIVQLMSQMLFLTYQKIAETPVLVELAQALKIDVAQLQEQAERMVKGEEKQEEAKPTLEAQVQRILAGESYVDVLGKTPKKGTPEHKEWERQRVAIYKAVKKAEAAEA